MPGYIQGASHIVKTGSKPNHCPLSDVLKDPVFRKSIISVIDVANRIFESKSDLNVSVNMLADSNKICKRCEILETPASSRR